jgi:hypothetical protein
MTKEAMKEKPYFIHIRDTSRVQRFWDTGEAISPTGGATIAVAYNPDIEAHAYAVALCSPKDNYNKKIGRKVAEGRLRTHPFILEGYSTMREVEEELRWRYPDGLGVTTRGKA